MSSIHESKDLGSHWRDWVETVDSDGGTYLRIRDSKPSHTYWLGAEIDGLVVEKVHFNSVSLLECRFNGGIWVDVVFADSQVNGVQFHNLYFENVDFTGALFDKARFDQCVFHNCVFPDGGVDSMGLIVGCRVVLGVDEPEPVKEVEERENPGVVPSKAEKSPSLDRFDGLERG